jgi:hypothetical protein
MTIILQHQFWDLAVSDTGFEVGLSFGGIPEKLAVPFAAIKGFFDPSVQFGLQFEEGGAEAADASTPAQANKPTAVPSPAPPMPPPATKPAAKPEPKPDPSGAEVVSLDRFRKK